MINLHILINPINQPIEHLGRYACQNMVATVTINSDRLCDIIHLITGPEAGIVRFVFPRISMFPETNWPVANVTAFSKISGKEDSLARYTEDINVILIISVPFDFPPGISWIFNIIARISEIQQFSDSPEPFRGCFHTIFPRLESSGGFGWMHGKHPWPSFALILLSLFCLLEIGNGNNILIVDVHDTHLIDLW